MKYFIICILILGLIKYQINYTKNHKFYDMVVTYSGLGNNEYLLVLKDLKDTTFKISKYLPQKRGFIGDTVFVSYNRLTDSWIITPNFYARERRGQMDLENMIRGNKHIGYDTVNNYLWSKITWHN